MLKKIKAILYVISYYGLWTIPVALLLFLCFGASLLRSSVDITLNQLIEQLTLYREFSTLDPEAIAPRVQYIGKLYPTVLANEPMSTMLIQKYISLYSQLNTVNTQTLIDYLSILDIHQRKVLSPTNFSLNPVNKFLEIKAEVTVELTESVKEYNIDYDRKISALTVLPIAGSILIVTVIAGIKYLSGF